MSVKFDTIKMMILKMAEVIEENKEYLTKLDADIGDGDHGINMSKGFKIAAEKINALTSDQIEDLIKSLSMALISNVGGSSGPLYGTFFMKAAAVAKGKDEIDINDFVEMYEKGIEGVKMRGKSTQGEKTMLDVLVPALDSLKHSLSENIDTKTTLEIMLEKAKEGLEYTKTIAATKGRASYLGDRSIGHIDPGAMSSYLLLETMANCLK